MKPQIFQMLNNFNIKETNVSNIWRINYNLSSHDDMASLISGVSRATVMCIKVKSYVVADLHKGYKTRNLLIVHLKKCIFCVS